ncbi:MAG: MobF family relaxase [Microbacterium sp.]
MVVSVKEMHAGTKYRYLLDTVADVEGVRELSGSAITAYYGAEGTPPGRWLGSGVAALGLTAGQLVTEQHMQRLFTRGVNPVDGTRLGRRFTTSGPRTSVSGFDFTFSPPKSLSAWWAVADHGTRERIYEAHQAALADTIAAMEARAARTRLGKAGAAQVETRGVVATAFDHWDSRAADPQLHTHVVVANVVQGPDGKWRTLDSRGALFPATVAFSELYDAVLADKVTAMLGVQWEERATGRGGKTRRFEIAGVPAELCEAFSTRTHDIDAETDRLAGLFRASRGHEPRPVDMIGLRQQATLATRPDKTVRPLTELVALWRDRAAAVLGHEPADLRPAGAAKRTPAQWLRAGDLAVAEFADKALKELEQSRTTWTTWNAMAATNRVLKEVRFASTADRLMVTDRVVEAIADRAIRLDGEDGLHVPAALRRADGTSAFTRTGGDRYTSPAILAAETRLLAAGQNQAGPRVDAGMAHQIATAPTSDGFHLSSDQAAAVTAIAASGRVVDILVGPAGTGKTTTLEQLRVAWEATHGPGSVRGLAPSAAAADVLADSLGIPTENTAKWLYETSTDRKADRKAKLAKARRSGQLRRARQIATNIDQWRVRSGELLIVDEASLAGTLALDELRAQAEAAGAKLVLVGDWAQLSAVDAGGAFGMLARDRDDVAELVEVRRFTETWEKNASTLLRVGEASALDAYTEHDRISSGTKNDMVAAVYAAWLADTAAGKMSMMIAADNALVSELNQRARSDLVAAGKVEAGGAVLHDGALAGRGDVIVTRTNDRRKSTGTRSWVKNGDLWEVVASHGDGSLTVKRDRNTQTITLDADYVAEHVELAYATTVHRAQGSTVDTAHALVTDTMTRELLYVAMTRAKNGNHAYVATTDDDDAHDHKHTHEAPTDARTVLAGILAHTGAPAAATEVAADAASGLRLDELIAQYEVIAQVAHADRWTQVLAAAGVEEVESDEARRRVVTLLRHLDAAGHDPATAAIGCARGGPLGDEPAGVLADRLDALIARLDAAGALAPARPRMIGGLVPAADDVTDPDLRRALTEREQRITAEVSRAVERQLAGLADAQQPWHREFGTPPATVEQRRTWMTGMAVVAAYRERAGITDAGDTLGPPPTDARLRVAYARAISARQKAIAVAETGSVQLGPRTPGRAVER